MEPKAIMAYTRQAIADSQNASTEIFAMLPSGDSFANSTTAVIIKAAQIMEPRGGIVKGARIAANGHIARNSWLFLFLVNYLTPTRVAF